MCFSVPLPPCTASPGGLLSAIAQSSRWITIFWISAASRSETAGRGFGSGRAAVAGGGAVTPGGRRTV